MSYSVRASNADPFKSDDEVKVLRKEVADYQKCVRGNPDRLMAITSIIARSGHTVDAECCAPVTTAVLQSIGQHLCELLLRGLPINGKTDGWSIGCFGSRWIDLDTQEDGVDYIRCAFYSKKHYKGEWKHEKPYAIIITVEKRR